MENNKKSCIRGAIFINLLNHFKKNKECMKMFLIGFPHAKQTQPNFYKQLTNKKQPKKKKRRLEFQNEVVANQGLIISQGNERERERAAQLWMYMHMITNAIIFY